MFVSRDATAAAAAAAAAAAFVQLALRWGRNWVSQWHLARAVGKRFTKRLYVYHRQIQGKSLGESGALLSCAMCMQISK